MNDLNKLQKFIPQAKEDYQYSELAKKIVMAVSLGKRSVTMAFNQPLSDGAMDALESANVEVNASTTDSYTYEFEF
ncbi:hypothetical protein [Companilactobacillus bobalius]|uniref:Uncharacterized protein n=2 Tax=Companilactobacillus bobalius TaxID=2801451 RepID=A0A202F7V2_9LACO|nr:hypothetical protein [Companilactobacillus bobalius]GEO58508.1 hypothetical protein LBO01_16370 [Companilactobacillus paralimentarius]KAE9557548.1 hypothetical protein ATN92_15450 [Companilactobacillus bobalius]KAE9563694.1 hypothetical protein ATN92_02900 [Companilactobacillus bobalius]KRK83439.1 hypothetical protein FC78_GL001395 [Companilactobacillus bobalius DSM 19674]OVE96517.1 hypothetical protein LKACC16343_02184 [Companilactobacillus bobalius]